MRSISRLIHASRVARAAGTAHIVSGAVILLAIANTSLSAQAVLKPMTATAVVPAVAKVVSTSPLVTGSRLQSGALYVSGTVVSTNNGSFALQARLGSAIADTVMGRMPDGTLVMLTEPGWVTVATGPGGPNQTSNVTFLVKWARGSKRRPVDAEAIPVVYRVLTQN
jgi:hypothetical protein